ncbi:hypothetical protein MJO28_007957 [Puccinia striiformis f. sp. tritici]|uniref:Uncharacterized protein n=1 Tax=Puccinia striiformis f. sp. tritici TaxID=168172 RepID=A0ACC0EAT2_9BASI|nr:hypothetical protein MJO28_007957 [Puccinia striiformis f. sp. tritici]
MVFSHKEATDDKGLSAIPLLKNDNYGTWESMMVLFLNSRGLLKVCTEEQASPFSDEVESKNACALFHMCSTVDKSIYNSIFKLHPDYTAYQIWSLLKKKYANNSIFALCRVFQECLAEFKSIGEDITERSFAAQIISRVTTVKPLLMEVLAAEEETVLDPYRLLEKLRLIATHEDNTLQLDIAQKKVDTPTAATTALSTALSTTSNNYKGKKRARVVKTWDCTGPHGHDPKADYNHVKQQCWEENPQLKPKKFRPGNKTVN